LSHAEQVARRILTYVIVSFGLLALLISGTGLITADNVVTAGELSALREMLEHKKPGAEAFVSGHGYRFGQSIIMIGSSAHGWRRGMTVSYGDHAGRAERYVRMFIAAQPKK
jgi:hypothetical protein